MKQLTTDLSEIFPIEYLPVALDGQLLGFVSPTKAGELVESLRKIKMNNERADKLHASVPKTLEIAFLPSNQILN